MAAPKTLSDMKPPHYEALKRVPSSVLELAHPTASQIRGGGSDEHVQAILALPHDERLALVAGRDLIANTGLWFPAVNEGNITPDLESAGKPSSVSSADLYAATRGLIMNSRAFGRPMPVSKIEIPENSLPALQADICGEQHDTPKVQASVHDSAEHAARRQK